MLKSYGWWGGVVVVVVVAHKILVSAPVPWIGDLGLGDWGLGLDNLDIFWFIYFKSKSKDPFSDKIQLFINQPTIKVSLL